MTTPDFTSPAVHLHDSGADQHTDVPSRKKKTSSPAGSNAERRAFLRSYLDTTAWWTLPRPSIVALIKDARAGEWTLKAWQRHGRVWWLRTFGRTGRLLPWLAARWTVEQPPTLWGELPAVRDVADDPEIERWPDAAYRVANWLSWMTDSATRTGVGAAGLWLLGNWANNVPVLHYLIWDKVTAAYWWPGFLHLLRAILPILVGLAVIAGVAVVATWQSKRRWRQRREDAAKQLAEMDDDEEEVER